MKSGAKKIMIVVVHDDIKYVSDRSLREFLKKLSKIVRRVQFDEARKIVESESLTTEQIDSIMDHMQNEVQSVPMYYLQKIEKGSFLADLAVGASALVVLGKVIEKVVTDVATKNKFYLRMIDYLKGQRSVEFPLALQREIGGQNLGGRFFVENTSITETKSRVILHVEIGTPLEFEDKFPEEFSEARLLAILEQRLRDGL
jgi:hypothetical protein